MRVQFGGKIFLCSLVRKIGNSRMLFITTSNGVYSVNCKTEENADACFKQLLRDGWCDFSDYQYMN